MVTASNVTVASGATIAASSLLTAADPDGDPVTYYGLYDNTPGAGYFDVNGVAEPALKALYLTPAQLAETTFVAGPGGTSGTSYDLWVGAYDGTAWTSPNWTEFHVNVAAYQPPVVTASNVTVASGATIAASSLFTASDPEGQPITYYGLYDNTPGAGYFDVNGVAEPALKALYLTPAQLAETTFVAGPGGTSGTSYDLWVGAYDGTAWTSPNWTEFHVNVAAYQPPVVTASNVTVASGATIAASSLFTASDPEGQPITYYGLYDNTPGAGYFDVNGVAEPALKALYLTPAQLAETTFVAGPGGTSGTSYDLWVGAYDGTAWTSPNWTEFHVNVAAYQPPVVTASNVTVASGATIAASSLFTASDPEGQPITYYGLYDNTPGAGYFDVNGVAEPALKALYLTPAQLAETTFVAGPGGTSGTSYDLWVGAYDGTAWTSPNWTEFHVNVAAYQPPVVTASNVTVASGATIAASSLFTASDPEGQPITYYGLYDNTPGAGYFDVNGVAEPALKALYLTPAQLAETTFVAGPGGTSGTSYDLWVGAYDGTAWTSPNWTEFHVNVLPSGSTSAMLTSGVQSAETDATTSAASSQLEISDASSLSPQTMPVVVGRPVGGDGENDTFVFNHNLGSAAVNNSAPGLDATPTIHAMFADFSDLNHGPQSGADTLVAEGADAVGQHVVTLALLHHHNFIVG